MIWNVVDRRRRPYRWAKLHAIIEAAWHDNSVADADQAPGTTLDTEITFDEREGISLNEAINWANSQSCPVTLYLYDGEKLQTPPEGEVEAAARVLDDFGRRYGWWAPETPTYDHLDPIGKEEFEVIVEGVLEAAARARGVKSA